MVMLCSKYKQRTSPDTDLNAADDDYFGELPDYVDDMFDDSIAEIPTPTFI